MIEQGQTRNVAEEHVRFVANTAMPRAMTTEEIEEDSAVEELECLRQSVETGIWENSNCTNYIPIRDELFLFGKIIGIRETRIVVPKKLRARVIELVHEGHQGMVKIKQRFIQRSGC